MDDRFGFLSMDERDLLLHLLGEYVKNTSRDDEHLPVGRDLLYRIPSPAVNETNEEKVERYSW